MQVKIRAMISTKFYQDKRYTKGDNNKKAPIKLMISKKGTTALITTEVKVLPSQWDPTKEMVVNCDNARQLNLILSKFKLSIDDIILNMINSGSSFGMNALEIKNYIISILYNKNEEVNNNTFLKRYEKFISSKTKENTRSIYTNTLNHIKRYESNLQNLSFEDIDKKWLIGFDYYLLETSPSKNSRNIHLRNIRAVFNDAIDDGVTSNYPFRKFKIKNTETAKRALTVPQLQKLFSFNIDIKQKESLDVFKLIFYLCGINMIDLFNLKHSNVVNGRLEYYRAKTGKRYSIKLTNEAIEIINMYKGTEYLLNIHERYKNYKDYNKSINMNLKKITSLANQFIDEHITENISTYWARHSWATVAAELDIPKETIAAGLGHNIGSPITSIYIDFNLKKVDEANRKIIDYILYNKV